jgi:hypothetical protein
MRHEQERCHYRYSNAAEMIAVDRARDDAPRGRRSRVTEVTDYANEESLPLSIHLSDLLKPPPPKCKLALTAACC